MKINRTVHHVFLENGKPHQLNQFNDGKERFPGMMEGPVLMTLNPALSEQAFHTEEFEIYSENEDFVNISINLCLDKKPPNPVIDLKNGGRKRILQYLRDSAGLEYSYRKGTSVDITPLGLDPIKGRFSLINRFAVRGSFKIVDVDLFSKALTGGVGRRFSYGYGMMMIRQQELAVTEK